VATGRGKRPEQAAKAAEEQCTDSSKLTKSERMKAVWVKSSLSFSNGNCVEVAELPGGSVGVRNSRDPGGPVLEFTQAEWDAFLGGARRGEFDRFGSTP
jgi:Domain of unknown function (DUF397)